MFYPQISNFNILDREFHSFLLKTGALLFLCSSGYRVVFQLLLYSLVPGKAYVLTYGIAHSTVSGG